MDAEHTPSPDQAESVAPEVTPGLPPTPGSTPSGQVRSVGGVAGVGGGGGVPFYRAHRMLAGSVALLFGAVGAVMSLSLASCQSTGGPASGGVVKKETSTREEAEVLARVPAAALANISTEPEMRIRLAAAVGEVELKGYLASAETKGGKAVAGPVFLGPIGGQAGPMQFAGPLRVRMTAEGWILTDGNGKSLRLESPGELVVSGAAADWTMGEGVPPAEQTTGAPGPMVVVTPVGGSVGAPYPGRIWLVPRSELPTPAFDVIEHVGLEKYLVGVVVKEMYQNWPKEAFKVQAVCARTYALHERSRGQQKKRAFDVESTTRDQAYAGASTNKTAIEAVNATRGVVLAYDGEILRTYYSSTCGGRTGSAKDTWPITRGYEYNLLPPIQAQVRDSACQDSPIYTWTVTRSADDLTRRIKAFGEANQQIVRQIAGIHALEVMETAPTGRPSVYKLVEPGGKWYKIKAEDLRLACNTSVTGLPAITSKTRVNSGDIEFKVTKPTQKLTGKALLEATSVQITGRGFGHGVGMCQYCARGMAARGDGWQKMMGVFYPGADVVKAYK